MTYYASFAPAVMPMAVQMNFFGDVLLHDTARKTTRGLFAVLSGSILSRAACLDAAEQSRFAHVLDAAKAADLKEKNSLVRITMANCTVGPANRVMVMIKSENDWQMMKLGFPRGCTVLWDAAARDVDIRGFYPKFDNDAHQEAAEWKDAAECRFFKKFSGFLGHIIAFAVADEAGAKTYFWTACSKNSSNEDSIFVQTIREMAAEWMTPALVKELADGRLYLGGEFMCPKDDMHGYIAKRRQAVITCVGAPPAADCPRIVTHWQTDAIMDFCERFGLPHDDAVTVSGPHTPAIMAALFEERDTMLYSTYAARMAQLTGTYEAVRVRKGTVDHAEAVGDVLEGFVIHTTKVGGGSETKKFKLPHYTFRTFFLRKLLRPFVGRAYVPNAAHEEAALAKYLQHWCCTEAGRALFAGYARRALCLAATGTIGVSSHVALAERAVSAEPVAERDNEKKPRTVTVVMVTGPVGSGKSAFAEALAARVGGRLVDGDAIAPGGNTQRLSIERNPCTLAAIAEGLRAGDGPVVVSMGGGAVTRTDDETGLQCVLHEMVATEFRGCELRLVSVVMALSPLSALPPAMALSALPPAMPDMMVEGVQEGLEACMRAVAATYDGITIDFTRGAVVDRTTTRGVWPAAMLKDCRALHEHSHGNRKHTEAIVRAAQHNFTAPFVADNVRESVLSLFATPQLDGLVDLLRAAPAPGPLASLVEQVRTVVLVSARTMPKTECRHITQFFSGSGDKYLKNSDLGGFKGAETPTAGARLVTLSLVGKKDGALSKCSFVVLLNGKHITVSAGVFKPKDMAAATAWFLEQSDENAPPRALELADKKGVYYAIGGLVARVPSRGGANGEPFQRAIPANFEVDDTVKVEILLTGVAMGPQAGRVFFVRRA